jgi:hypothetical protein
MSTRILKLRQAGESVRLDPVTAVTFNAGAQYPDYTFRGVVVESGETVDVYVPQVAAERQCHRFGLTPTECVGHVLTIARETNANDAARPYWGIYDEAGAAPSAVAPASRAAPVVGRSVPADRVTPTHPGVIAVAGAYFQLMDQVARRMARIATAAGLPCCMADVQAATFSVFRYAADHGWRPGEPAPSPASSPAPVRRAPVPPPVVEAPSADDADYPAALEDTVDDLPF